MLNYKLILLLIVIDAIILIPFGLGLNGIPEDTKTFGLCLYIFIVVELIFVNGIIYTQKRINKINKKYGIDR